MFTASVPFPEQEEAAEEEAEEGEAAGEAAGEADGEVEAEDTNAEGKALGKYPPPTLLSRSGQLHLPSALGLSGRLSD